MFLTQAYGIRQLLVGNNIGGMYAKLEAFLVFLSTPLLFHVILSIPTTSFLATVLRV